MLDFTQQPEAQEYKIGLEIPYNGRKALVVRIVDHVALFEIPLKRYVVDELYVELLTDQGETVFISLRRNVQDLPRTDDLTMRGPEPLMKVAEDRI